MKYQAKAEDVALLYFALFAGRNPVVIWRLKRDLRSFYQESRMKMFLILLFVN